MSNVDVERQLADYFGWLEDQIEPLPRPADLGRRTRLWAIAAAAATMIGLVAGLVLIAGRDTGDEPAPATVPTPKGPSLGDVDDVGAGAWVYPSVLPAGVEYAYPSRDPGSSTSRSISFVDAANSLIYVVTVDPAGWDQARTGDVTAEELAGHPWQIRSVDDVWFATRHLDSTTVRLSTPVEFDDDARAFIEGLVVIDEADLPTPALDFDGDFVEVARYDGADGIAAAVRVSESNGYFCVKTYDGFGGGGGGGCVFSLSSGEVLSGVSIATGPTREGDGVRVDVASLARADVARVEVEFVDGAVVSTAPTDLSGRFDVGFWIVAADVDVDVDVGLSEPHPPPGGIDTPVAEIRAFDSTGAILDTYDPAERSRNAGQLAD